MNIMTIDEQIAKLNAEVKCRLAPSPIHGIGVFAMRDISQGERLHTQRKISIAPMQYRIPLSRFGDLRFEVRELILDRWAQPELGRAFLSPNDDANMDSFMNHSHEPNSQYGIALRNIKIGEEITEDYLRLGAPLNEISKRHYSFAYEQ